MSAKRDRFDLSGDHRSRTPSSQDCERTLAVRVRRLAATYDEHMDSLLSAAAALAAPTGVAFLFWLAIRSLIRADQTERAAIARMEAEERAKSPRFSSLAPSEGSETAVLPGE